jgi:hypothetical protein
MKYEQVEIEEEQLRRPRGLWVTLGLVLLLTFGFLGLVMLYSHLPRASVSTNTSSDLVTPTVGATNLVSTLNINHTATVSGLEITVQQARQATSFSDLRKHDSPYIVRVYVQVKNNGQTAVGIPFASQVKLLLPDGETVKPQLVTVAPTTMPDTTETGYLDFPVQNTVSLSQLALWFDNNTTVSFGNK